MARNSILWKYEDSEGTSIYLLGTIHLNAHSLKFRKEQLKNIIPQLDQIYTETDLTGMEGPDFQKNFRFPDDKHISDYLTGSALERYERSLKRFTGIDLTVLGRYHPMIILNIISASLLRTESGPSTDEFVYDLATANDKKIEVLESLDEQMEVYQQIDIDYQLIMLKRLLSDLSGSRKKLIENIELYNAEKIHKLYRSSRESLGMLKGLLLYDRNAKMAKKTMDMPYGEKILVAVGAAHLSGGKGILHLCHRNGMTFKPVLKK